MSPHQLQRQCTVFPMMILDFDEKIRTAERCRADPAISDDALDSNEGAIALSDQKRHS